MIVPGEMMRTISRETRPLQSFGSYICSHTATL